MFNLSSEAKLMMMMTMIIMRMMTMMMMMMTILRRLEVPFQLRAQEDLEAEEAAQLSDRSRLDQEEGRSLRASHICQKGRRQYIEVKNLCSFYTFNIQGFIQFRVSPHFLWQNGFYEIISKPRRPLIYRETMSHRERDILQTR